MAQENCMMLKDCVWTVAWKCLLNPARFPGTGSRPESARPKNRAHVPRGMDGACSKRAYGGRIDDRGAA
jgi:hypothetical protein